VNHYAAIDVSLELSCVCIVDATGKVVKEAKVETRDQGRSAFSARRASRPSPRHRWRLHHRPPLQAPHHRAKVASA